MPYVLVIGAFRRGNNPQFYWGKKNSFSMRLSEGKLTPVSRELNGSKVPSKCALPVYG